MTAQSNPWAASRSPAPSQRGKSIASGLVASVGAKLAFVQPGSQLHSRAENAAVADPACPASRGSVRPNRLQRPAGGAGAAEEKLDAAGSEAVIGVQAAFAKKQPASQVPAAPSGQVLGGLLAGGGIALAALGSSAAFVVKTFASLTWQSTLAGILAAVAAVAVPASLVAHLKLRRRDLSAIPKASGWAINARMRLTRRQADYFTCVPGYPSGRAERRPLWGLRCRHHPRQEPYELNAHVRICAGGAGRPASLPRPLVSFHL